MLNDILDLVFPSKPDPIMTFGALQSPVDVRNIEVASFQLPTVIPKEYFIDISAIPVRNQHFNPSCVGQAEGTAIEYFELIEHGKAPEISRRFIFGQCKKEDGLPHKSGTFPSIARKLLRDTGAATAKTVPNEDNLTYGAYITFDITDEVKEDAYPRRTGGDAIVRTDEESLKQTLYQKGLVTITLLVDTRSWITKTGKLGKPNNVTEAHRVVLYGYKEESSGTMFYFRNSWGEEWGNKGNGSFVFDEYDGFIVDASVYTDIPNELLKKAKEADYVFTLTLRRGATGYETKKLQERLGAKADGVFGPMTEAKVKAYQSEHGLFPDGVVGPKTRAVLNNRGEAGEEEEATLQEFCAAIKQFEGWYPGSRSYRNNNPGNLRKWHSMVGQDGGFAVFATYEEGWKALVELVERAKTGKSSYYRPEMSFFEFFSVYAPSDDGNHPKTYATYVAQKCKVGIDYKIKNLT